MGTVGPVSSDVETVVMTPMASAMPSMPVITPMVAMTPDFPVSVSSPIQPATPTSGIEQELLLAGYAPRDKVIVRSSNGQRSVAYVKCLNKVGLVVFVELDVDGFVSSQPDDLSMVEVQKADILPLSVKMGVKDCAGLDVCGVAFECKDAICTVTHDPRDMSLRETSFVYEEKYTERMALLGDGFIAYPIVKVSEIRANPDLVLANTRMVTARIRNAAFDTCVKQLHMVDGEIERAHHLMATFNHLKHMSADKLGHSIALLEEINNGYQLNAPTTDEELIKYRTVLFNLRRRNELVVDLLRICDIVGRTHQHLKAANELIAQAGDRLMQEFVRLDEVWIE